MSKSVMSNFIILLLISAVVSACSEVPLILERTDKGIELSAELPAGYTQIEVRIESERNNTISKLSDRSTHWPDLENLSPMADRYMEGRGRGRGVRKTDMWFPVVDIELEEGIEGVFEFTDPKGTGYAINENSYEESGTFHDRIVIPANRLEHWENSLLIKSGNNLLENFYLRKEFVLASNKLQYVFKPLSKIWNGKISIYAKNSSDVLVKLGEKELSYSQSIPQKPFQDDALGTESLVRSLIATLDFTLRCQNDNPNSPIYGGLNIFYDLDAHTYRTNHWFWAWGASVGLLLRADKIPSVSSHYATNTLLNAADKIGNRSLAFICDDKESPVFGQPIALCGLGSSISYSPADAGFLVGWAWIPLYEAVNKTEYINAAKGYIQSTNKLVDQFGLIPHDYSPTSGRWNNYTNDESAFNMEAYAEMYRVTKDKQFQMAGQRYMQPFMDKFQTENGLWNRFWMHDTKKSVPTETHTRGMGWAMEALLAAYRLSSDDLYLNNAKKMADQLISFQDPSGWWGYLFSCSDELGISEKGTALWSYLLYRLYDHTKEGKYLAAARKSLSWCLANQYYGADQEAYGSLPGNTFHSAVYYRQFFNISCTYTSAFFGMAVIEELKLQDYFE